MPRVKFTPGFEPNVLASPVLNGFELWSDPSHVAWTKFPLKALDGRTVCVESKAGCANYFDGLSRWPEPPLRLWPSEVKVEDRHMPNPPTLSELGNSRLRDLRFQDLEKLLDSIQTKPHLVLTATSNPLDVEGLCNLWQQLTEEKKALLVALVGSWHEASLQLLLVPSKLRYKNRTCEEKVLLAWFVPVPPCSLELVDCTLQRFRDMLTHPDTHQPADTAPSSNNTHDGSNHHPGDSSGHQGGDAQDMQSDGSAFINPIDPGNGQAEPKHNGAPPSPGPTAPRHDKAAAAAQNGKHKKRGRAAADGSIPPEAVGCKYWLGMSVEQAEELQVQSSRAVVGVLLDALHTGVKTSMNGWVATLKAYPSDRHGLAALERRVTLQKGLHIAHAWPPVHYITTHYEAHKGGAMVPQRLPKEFATNECAPTCNLLSCSKQLRCAVWRCRNEGTLHEVEIRATPGKGWGVFALKRIPKEEAITEYVGEVFRSSKVEEMTRLRQHVLGWYYMFGNGTGCFRRDSIIDATHLGNVSRFINHSCEPNCTVVSVCQPHTPEDLTSLQVVVAKHDIPAGEELTILYQADLKEQVELSKIPPSLWCKCQSAKCRGYVMVDEMFGAIAPEPEPEPEPAPPKKRNNRQGGAAAAGAAGGGAAGTNGAAAGGAAGGGAGGTNGAAAGAGTSAEPVPAAATGGGGGGGQATQAAQGDDEPRSPQAGGKGGANRQQRKAGGK